MQHNLKISVVIPCYNEEEGVRKVIGRMPRTVDEVVVVDNNCTDGTAQAVSGRFPWVRLLAGDGTLYWAGVTLEPSHQLTSE